MAKKFHKLKKKLTKSYRLVVSDEETFEERHSFNISPLKGYSFIALFSLVLITLTSLFFFKKSPQKENPVYSSYVLKNMELIKEIKQLKYQIDSFKNTNSRDISENGKNIVLQERVKDLQNQLKSIGQEQTKNKINDKNILALEQQVTNLKNQISSFERVASNNTKEDKNTLVLKQQINNLKTKINSLEKVSQENKSKEKTINNLNQQIVHFNKQISASKKTLAKNKSQIKSLEQLSLNNKNKDNTILELKNQVADSKNQIKSLENKSTQNQTTDKNIFALEYDYSKTKKKAESISIELNDKSKAVFYKNIDAVATSNRDSFLKLFKDFNFKQNYLQKTESTNITKNTSIEKVPNSRIIVLDVRKSIESGVDPYLNMLQTANSLKDGETLKIVNFYEPTPLINKLKQKGYKSWTNKINHELFYIFFKKQKAFI